MIIVVSMCWPFPVADFWHVLAVFGDVALVFNKLVPDHLLHIRSARAKSRYTINHGGHKVEAVEVVHHNLVEWCTRRAFLLVTMHMKIPVVGAAIGEPMNQGWIAMVGEDHWLIDGEELIKFSIAETMWVVIL